MRFLSGCSRRLKPSLAFLMTPTTLICIALNLSCMSEFLDIEREGVTANLVQPVRDLLHILTRCLLTQALLKWQLEVGKKHEVVVTTKDELWRYQLNDMVKDQGMVKVAGFTPEGGIPFIRYVAMITANIHAYANFQAGWKLKKPS